MEVLSPQAYAKQRQQRKVKEVEANSTVEPKAAHTRYPVGTIAGDHAAKLAEEAERLRAEFSSLLNAEADHKALQQQQVDVRQKEEQHQALVRGLEALEQRLQAVKAEQGTASTAEDILRLRREHEELTASLSATRVEVLTAEFSWLRAQAPIITRNLNGIRRLTAKLDEEAALLNRRRLALRQMFAKAQNEEGHRRNLLATCERRLADARDALTQEATRGSGLRKPGAGQIGAPPAGQPYQPR